MNTPLLRGGIAAVVAALALTSCSSSTTSETTSDAGAAASSAAATSAEASAAASSAAAAEPVRLAAVVANTSDPFWSTMICGMQQQAAEAGADLQMFSSTSTDDAQVASNFDSALLTEPQGLIVQPFNNNQFIAQYQQLMGEGVPVVTSNATSPPAEYQVIFSSTDTAQYADELASVIPEGEGTMVYLGGAPGIPPLEGRTLPFFEAVKAARPDLTPLENNYSGFDINKTTTAVSALILANPDLKLIIAASGPDAVGAAAALKQSGKEADIALIGFDAVPAEVEALKAGTIDALIAQNPTAMGRELVTSLTDYLAANPDGGAVTPIDPKMIDNAVLTAETVDDPANADFVYTESCG